MTRERGEPKRTICTSQDVPSVMYLKHRSHTHKTSLAFSRLTAPAKRSIVRPCPITSSPSPSVSGYGEKYLWAEGKTRGHDPRGGKGETKNGNYITHQVLICQVPKLTLSKLRRPEAIVGRAAGGWVVSRESCAFGGDADRRRLRVLVPFTRRGGEVSWPGDTESRGGVVARMLSAETHSSSRLSVSR
jgi:hypothetical protein